jgi:hypothetical protein
MCCMFSVKGKRWVFGLNVMYIEVKEVRYGFWPPMADQELEAWIKKAISVNTATNEVEPYRC